MSQWDWVLTCDDESIKVKTFTKAQRALESMVKQKKGRCYISAAHKRQLPKKGNARLTYQVKEQYVRGKANHLASIICEIEILRIERTTH